MSLNYEPSSEPLRISVKQSGTSSVWLEAENVFAFQGVSIWALRAPKGTRVCVAHTRVPLGALRRSERAESTRCGCTRRSLTAIRKGTGLFCGSFLRKGGVFAYGGRIENLKDLTDPSTAKPPRRGLDSSRPLSCWLCCGEIQFPMVERTLMRSLDESEPEHRERTRQRGFHLEPFIISKLTSKRFTTHNYLY